MEFIVVGDGGDRYEARMFNKNYSHDVVSAGVIRLSRFSSTGKPIFVLESDVGFFHAEEYMRSLTNNERLLPIIDHRRSIHA